MIDYLKLRSNEKAFCKRLHQDNRLTPQKKTEYLQARDTYYLSHYTWEGIDFNFKNQGNSVEICFKPHYFFNYNKHNSGNFSLSDCTTTIQTFVDEFQIPVNTTDVIGIEYGVNVDLDIPVEYVVENAILFGKKKLMHTQGIDTSKTSITNPKQVYRELKLYSKSHQFPEQAVNQLRIELKSKQHKFTRKLAIAQLGNLLDENNYGVLKTDLIKASSNLLIIDPELLDYLNGDTSSIILHAQRPSFWLQHLKAHRNKFSQQKSKYFEELRTSGHRDLSKLIHEAVLRKSEEL